MTSRMMNRCCTELLSSPSAPLPPCLLLSAQVTPFSPLLSPGVWSCAGASLFSIAPGPCLTSIQLIAHTNLVCTFVPLATPSSQAIFQPFPSCPVFLTLASGMFVLAPGLFGLASMVSPLISLLCFFLRHTLSFPCPSAVASLAPRHLATKVKMPCVLVAYWMPLEMCTQRDPYTYHFLLYLCIQKSQSEIY